MAYADLMTPQGETLKNPPWQSYPRPQMKRENYVNLNGVWDFTVSELSDLPDDYDQTILVPFCPESVLSGVKNHAPEGSFLFYRRQLDLVPQAGFRVLLHVGAADQTAEVYVNQKKIGTHIGGYESFCFDITDALEGTNELVIRVQDDLRNRAMPYGKQIMNPGGMWYTPVSGIWQTLWLEQVPQTHVETLDIQVTAETATVTVTPALSGNVTCQGVDYPLTEGVAVITPEEPSARAWRKMISCPPSWQPLP